MDEVGARLAIKGRLCYFGSVFVLNTTDIVLSISFLFLLMLNFFFFFLVWFGSTLYSVVHEVSFFFSVLFRSS